MTNATTSGVLSQEESESDAMADKLAEMVDAHPGWGARPQRDYSGEYSPHEAQVHYVTEAAKAARQAEHPLLRILINTLMLVSLYGPIKFLASKRHELLAWIITAVVDLLWFGVWVAIGSSGEILTTILHALIMWGPFGSLMALTILWNHRFF